MSIVLSLAPSIFRGSQSLADPGDTFKNPLDLQPFHLPEKKPRHDLDKTRDVPAQNDDDSDNRAQKLRNSWVSDYIDSDFSKRSFIDLVLSGTSGNPDDLKSMDASSDNQDESSGKDVQNSDKNDRGDKLEADSHDCSWFDPLPSDDSFGGPQARRKDERVRDRRMERLQRLTRSDFSNSNDWVPSPVDRLQNGAFGVAPDNGFPVPYTLNGFIEIQRKFPWEKEP